MEMKGELIILLLAITYILVLVVLILFEAIPVRNIKRKKLNIIFVLSLLDAILLYIAAKKSNELLLYVFLLVPLSFVILSWYGIRKKKYEKSQFDYFNLKENTYEIEYRLSMDLARHPWLRSTTGILWNGKLIIMPQPFSCKGEELNLLCKKVDDEAELYVCKEVNVRDEKIDLKKKALSMSLVITLCILPAVIFFDRKNIFTQGNWKIISEMLFSYLVLGFTKLVLYGNVRNKAVQIMKIGISVAFYIVLFGLVMVVVGIGS